MLDFLSAHIVGIIITWAAMLLIPFLAWLFKYTFDGLAWAFVFAVGVTASAFSVAWWWWLELSNKHLEGAIFTSDSAGRPIAIYSFTGWDGLGAFLAIIIPGLLLQAGLFYLLCIRPDRRLKTQQQSVQVHGK